MTFPEQLIENNHKWVQDVISQDPEFFERLSKQQSPDYLWIGCADSRVPANQILGLDPGGIFVHRNVANVVVHTDLNCLSVIQYAVEALKVKHIIVCGHYGCGGVCAALDGAKLGLIENWLKHVQDVKNKHIDYIESLDGKAREDKMCELNVLEQVENVCLTTIVSDAWSRGQELSVHGMIYGLDNGLLKDLGICVSSNEEVVSNYNKALAELFKS